MWSGVFTNHLTVFPMWPTVRIRVVAIFGRFPFLNIFVLALKRLNNISRHNPCFVILFPPFYPTRGRPNGARNQVELPERRNRMLPKKTRAISIIKCNQAGAQKFGILFSVEVVQQLIAPCFSYCSVMFLSLARTSPTHGVRKGRCARALTVRDRMCVCLRRSRST